uniref:Polycystic kidney disease 1a n=1 Tax=Hucho hucho TaxID=62062 RepID=A0A4W5JQ37_9TELE
MNHVSNLTDDFNVTVDRMNPMVNLTVTGVPGVVTQGSDQFLTTSVVLDMSVGATFRWSFGDGGYQEYDFKPPYNSSLYPPLPDSPTQVLLPNKVKYKYPQPGVYTVLVSVSNHYENRTQRIDMHVYSVLTHVDIETEPRLLQAGQPAAFEAHALPSAYGIVYTWDFGDGSASREGPQRRVNHTYEFGHSGIHNVCVSVNNTISWTEACAEMLVYEEIKGLTATSSAPTELNTPTMVSAHLEAGNNVTWSFDMGDGSMVTTAGSEVPHTYVKDGNYTVNVTAWNAVSACWTLVPVQVFVLQVVRLEPAGCIRELTQVDFQAFVSGNASSHLYEWSFGDGTPNQTHLGSPRISHSYWGSGDYHLSLLLSSGVNKANFFAWVCVQPAVSNVTLTPEKSNFRLGEESRFRASARPDFDYTYLWDFGVIDDSTPVQGHKDMVFTYKSPGQYLVTVTVSNNISCSNDSVLIQIQRPVGLVLIQHNGTRSDNLTLREVYLFTTSSLAPASLYTWDFGDGTPLTPGPNVTHVYNVSGVFNVTLTAANPVSSNHTRVAVAVLAPIRGLVVNADRVNVPINATVNFKAHLEEGDGVRFSWNLCDGCTPRLQEWKTHYTFRSVGTYNVIVTAESDVGSAQASVYIYVLRELEGLHIQPEEEMGGEGGCCYATNRVLHLQAALREGTNMSFSWNLLRELAPVSTALNLSGKTIPVNFSTPGPCDIFLRATNLLGTLAVNRTIQFLDPVGELYLETSVNPVAVNSSTSLTVLASKGSDLQYRWSANEGALGWNEPSVVHWFTSPGMKVVTVEVSNEISAETVSKFIDVQEVVTGVTFSTTNVTEQNFVATGVNVSLHGELRTGTNVSWTWLLPGRTEMGRRVSHVFWEPGPFTVMLNSTNDVSSEAFSRELTVQDKIQGLELRASKRIAAVGERVEFTIAKASGTNVSFILSISGDSTVFGLNQTYVHQFSRVDTYMVNLTAHNQVSSERRHLQVDVMEPVSMLSILDCCDAAMPVGVKKTFVADILTGNPVTFLWTFELHHLPLHHIAKEVTFNPDQAGTLTIYLRAFNLLNGQNITKHIQVQNILTEARVEARPRDTFINKTVMLTAGVTPQSTPVTYLWDFKDGSAPLLSTTSSVGHAYAFPGQYLVQVNCSNLVSWVVARVEVTIRVLECEEPEVQVVQAPRLAIWRYQPTLVEASVDLKGCIRYGAQYLWEIFSTPHCNYDHSVAAPLASKIPLPGEVDVRRLQLSVPKMALRSGNYSLVFSLSYQGVPLRKAACLQLTVMAARLVPIIEGGTYRVCSRTQDLQLSAEQSYDPNMDLDSQSLLNYHWDCVTTSKVTTHLSVNQSNLFYDISSCYSYPA